MSVKSMWAANGGCHLFELLLIACDAMCHATGKSKWLSLWITTNFISRFRETNTRWYCTYLHTNNELTIMMRT